MRHAAPLFLIFAVAFLPTCGDRFPMAPRETSAIKEIVTIHTAQVQYFSTYNRFARSLQELGSPASGPEGPSAAGLIDHDLASGEKGNYRFTVQATPNGYNVTAMPTQYGANGHKTYFSDQSMRIHEYLGQEPATVNDPALGE